MIGEASWILVGALALIFVGIFALDAWATRSGKRLWTEDRKIICPASGRSVEVTLVSRSLMGPWVGVRRCSAQRDPGDVRCDRRCLERLVPA